MSALPIDEAPAVEIVSAGNEVLLGDVLDTNSNWLSRRVTALGGDVRRTVMVRDEVGAIAAEIRGALGRRATLLFTVGGLGPTDDDLTLRAVAQATGRQLELHPGAEKLVREKYAELAQLGYVPSAEMNEPRLKMARLPRGATPLANPIGGAPGVVLEVGDSTVVSLPGVPDELMAIVSQSLAPLFETIFGAAAYAERALVIDLQDESVIADVLRAVDDAHPRVYVKSRARPFGADTKIRVTMSVRGVDEADVADALLPALEEAARAIAARGFAVRRE